MLEIAAARFSGARVALASQRCLQAGHHQRRRDAFARDVADRHTELPLRQRQKIVIVSADAERRAAVSGVVESGGGRQRLREQALLYFARDFHFAIQSLALCDFVGDLAHQVGVLEREAGLRRDRFQQAHVRTSVRLLRFLRAERDEAEKLVAHGQRQQQFGSKVGQFARSSSVTSVSR